MFINVQINVQTSTDNIFSALFKILNIKHNYYYNHNAQYFSRNCTWNVNCIEMLNLWRLWYQLLHIIRKHLHSAMWYTRDCSKDNSIPDMICNEIRYFDVTFVTCIMRQNRARAMETFAISPNTLVGRNWLRRRVNRASIYRVLSLVPDSNLSNGSTGRERRGRAREIAARKSPSHPVCIYSCTGRLTEVTYFFFLLRTCVLPALETKIKKQVEPGRKRTLFYCATIFWFEDVFSAKFNFRHIYKMWYTSV